MVQKYVKRPIEIEALQIHANVTEIKNFIGSNGDAWISDAAYQAGKGKPITCVTINTIEGLMQATDGDYIIKGIKWEFYPCNKDVFEQTYMLSEKGDK